MNRRSYKAKFAVTVMLLAGTALAWAARPETFTRIDVPGAAVTVASGINGDGFMVGWYCFQAPCNPARFRGFLRDPDGTFQDIIVPNEPGHPAIGTQARYISPQGVVIGDYLTLEDGATMSNPRFRGFAWVNGSITYFDAPEQAVYDNSSPPYPHSIIPRAINANGDIVGCIHDRNQADSMHGFLWHNGVFTQLADGMTMNNGITANGEIVGLDGGSTTAYHIDRFGNVERLAFQTADGTLADDTLAWDINSKGEIVGQAFIDGTTVGHAFLRDKKGEYRFIDPAGALSAVAFAISGNGNVVGQYRDSPGTHGFLLQRGED